MIFTPLTKKAMKLAFEAHKNQTDKTGVPYIFHPFHLAEQMTDENTVCAALLHDVVEDTEITFADLAEAGFPDVILDALRCLTHDPAVPYIEYVAALRRNPIAAAVKEADLRHNSDLTRMDIIDDAAVRRTEKYQQALKVLHGEEL